VIQIILLMLINIAYMIYFIVRRPFYRVKTREYNNEMYIHNLLMITLIELVLLVYVFMASQLSKDTKVLIGDAICGLIMEGALVNIVYFIFRTYNYHHEYTWKPFVRSDMFRINYTFEHLQWTKEYDDKDKKLMSSVRPRNEFLAAIKV
jgi:heme/copper-type cytochrome/quinol oxidase subunit 4